MKPAQARLMESILFFRYYPALDLFLLRLKNQTPIPYRCPDSIHFYEKLKAAGVQEA